MNLDTKWPVFRLDQVASTQLGKMLSSTVANKDRNSGTLLPYLRNRDVQWGRFILDDLPTMKFTAAESTKYSLRPGDVVICEGGEVGRAAIWSRTDGPIHFQKALHRVRCGPNLSPTFLYYLLRYYSYSQFFDGLVTGSTINHLPQEVLRNLPVPLPSLDQQLRLVDLIEQQFSGLDAADVAIEQAAKRSRNLRRSLLQSAFQKELA